MLIRAIEILNIIIIIIIIAGQLLSPSERPVLPQRLNCLSFTTFSFPDFLPVLSFSFLLRSFGLILFTRHDFPWTAFEY